MAYGDFDRVRKYVGCLCFELWQKQLGLGFIREMMLDNFNVSLQFTKKTQIY